MKALSDFLLRLLTRFPMARWSPVALRLIVGYGFMQHGFAKLSRGPDMFAAILQGMGVPYGRCTLNMATSNTAAMGTLAIVTNAPPDGMVDHTHRTRRRLRCTAR